MADKRISLYITEELSKEIDKIKRSTPVKVSEVHKAIVTIGLRDKKEIIKEISKNINGN